MFGLNLCSFEFLNKYNVENVANRSELNWHSNKNALLMFRAYKWFNRKRIQYLSCSNFMWSLLCHNALTAVSIHPSARREWLRVWDVGPANIPHSPASSGHGNSCLIGWLAGQLVITWWPPEVNKTGSFPRRLARSLARLRLALTQGSFCRLVQTAVRTFYFLK